MDLGWLMKRLIMCMIMVGCLAVCGARELKGVTAGNTELSVTTPGDRGCPITKEQAAAISEKYGSPLIIVVVKADNQKGTGPYTQYYSQCQAMAGSTPVSPVEVHGSIGGVVPASVVDLFFNRTIAQGETKSFARAFPVPARGNARLKAVSLRTGVSDEWVTCD